MTAKEGWSGVKRAASARPVRDADDPGAERRHRRLALAGRIAIVLAVAVVLLTVCAFAYDAWRSGEASGEDRTATIALLRHARLVRARLEPLAKAYSSAPATAPIDLQDYRARIEAVRVLVLEVNDIAVSRDDEEALTARDDILTGGSTIVDGLDGALDALASDDASAAGEAGAIVDAGLATLEAAEDVLAERMERNGWQP